MKRDLVSVTVSGGYKPLYYRSRELGSGLLRLQTNAPPTAHVTDVICWSMSEGIDHPVKAYLLALYMDLLITY